MAHSGKDAITIVIADDHPIVRAGLRALLESEPGFQVIGEAGDVPEALTYLEKRRPAILVLDLNMPGESSLQAMPRLHAASPNTRIVVLTMQRELAFAREALRAGAVGYVHKDAADTELVQAIAAAADDRTYLHPELGARLAAEPEGPPDGLTEREVEVLRLIALGHTNKEIGDSLFLSGRTVESHRAHIQQKLRLRSRAELVGYAREHGLV